jgi:hypothetical protein
MSDKWDDVIERERRKTAAPGKVLPLLSPDLSALPGPGDDYKAAAVPANGELTRLWCIMGKDQFRAGGKPYRFFQYVHLDSDGEVGFDQHGQVLSFRFSGMTPVLITVRGRNLIQICDYISLHRLPWIRVADRDFLPGEAMDAGGNPVPIITGITISEARTGEVLAGG